MTREEAIHFAVCLKNNWTIDFNDMEEFCDMAIEALQTDVVRCKHCKHWSGNWKMHNNHLCKRAQDQNIDYWTRGDDFCSYGERKGGEDE